MSGVQFFAATWEVFVLHLFTSANTDIGQCSISNKDVQDRHGLQYHGITFPVDRWLGWLSVRAMEHACEQEVGEECKRR